MSKKNETKFMNEKELSEAVAAMNNETMADSLVDLSNSNYWVAVIKYIASRMQLAESALFSIDAFEKPTEMARNQGIRIGLLDMIEFIKLEKESRSKKEAEAAEEAKKNGEGQQEQREGE